MFRGWPADTGNDLRRYRSPLPTAVAGFGFGVWGIGLVQLIDEELVHLHIRMQFPKNLYTHIYVCKGKIPHPVNVAGPTNELSPSDVAQ